jgi:putative transposase
VFVKLGYRYRLYPSGEQAGALLAEMNRCRWVWNHARALREQIWRTERRTVGYSELCRQLTCWRAQHEWLREGSADAQQQALRELCASYARAFKAWRRRGRKGSLRPPGFRSRRRLEWKTIRYTRNGHRVDGERVRVAGIADGLALRWSRQLPSKPHSVTVTLDSAGRWHASFRVERSEAPLPYTGRCAGVDLGVHCAYALSDGERVPNPRHVRRRHRALKRSQRAFARKQRGSANRAKARERVARVHALVTDARRDWQHRQTTRLVREHDLVCVEDLGVAGMTRSAKGTVERPGRNVRRKAGVNRSILDIGFAVLRAMFAYKALLYGRELRVVDRFQPSSKLCSGCGYAKAKLALSERTYHCGRCGLVLDRDVNAARNILAAGLAESQNACGGRVRSARPRPRGQHPAKQEDPPVTAGIPRL